MDKHDKLKWSNRLLAVGLFDQAGRWRDDRRRELRKSGLERAEAVDQAWLDMFEEYGPRLAEAESASFRRVLPVGAETVADLVDPDRQDTDTSAQMRACYEWIWTEFDRVVLDRPGGVTVDYGQIQSRPPVAMACRILETWARKPPDKRDGLYREIRQWAGGGAQPTDTDEPETETLDPYLAGLLDPKQE